MKKFDTLFNEEVWHIVQLQQLGEDPPLINQNSDKFPLTKIVSPATDSGVPPHQYLSPTHYKTIFCHKVAHDV